MNKAQIAQTLDRDIPLDEAVFIAITGLNNIKLGSKLTGLDRLKGAIILLQREVDNIEKEYQEFGG